MHWLYLFIAGIFEISWAVGMKFGFKNIYVQFDYSMPKEYRFFIYLPITTFFNFF